LHSVNTELAWRFGTSWRSAVIGSPEVAMKKQPGTVPDSPSPTGGGVRPTLPGGEYGSPAERYSFRDRDKKQPTLPPSVNPAEGPSQAPHNSPVDPPEE
jgi:hypothetical protein